MPGTFFYSSGYDMRFILVSEHMELLTRVCSLDCPENRGVPWLVRVTVLSTVEPKSYQ